MTLTNLLKVKILKCRKNAPIDFYRFGYLPTNDTIARFTPNDLDLLFQGKKYEIVISQEL